MRHYQRWEKVDDRQNELGYKSLFMTVQTIAGKERKSTLVFILGSRLRLCHLAPRYNERLKTEAEARGVFFVDVAQDGLDEQTRLVRPIFKHPDATDHHMHADRAADLWLSDFNWPLPPLINAQCIRHHRSLGSNRRLKMSPLRQPVLSE